MRRELFSWESIINDLLWQSNNPIRFLILSYESSLSSSNAIILGKWRKTFTHSPNSFVANSLCVMGRLRKLMLKNRKRNKKIYELLCRALQSKHKNMEKWLQKVTIETQRGIFERFQVSNHKYWLIFSSLFYIYRISPSVLLHIISYAILSIYFWSGVGVYYLS